MSTNQQDSATVHQDNVTSTLPVTKTKPEGTRNNNGRSGMTVRKSCGKRKKPPTTTTTSRPIIHPTSGRVVRQNSMKRENPPTTTTAITTIPTSIPLNVSNVGKKIKGGGRSGMTVRSSVCKRKSSPPTTHPYIDDYGYRYKNREEAERILNRPFNDSDMYRPWNREEENRIVGALDSKYSMDNFFSEEEATAGCKWDYSVMLSDLPSSNIEDDDGNKNSKTDKK